MERALSSSYGNPSSIHSYGREARSVVEHTRGAVAAATGARGRDVVFTAGGTEAVNLACSGTWRGRRNARRLLMSSVEHPAAAEFAKRLNGHGEALLFDVPAGQVPSATELEAKLVGVDVWVVQWINHETGHDVSDRSVRSAR